MCNIKIKPHDIPEGRMHVRVKGSGVRSLLFPLLQACVMGQRSKREGELIVS